VSVKLIFDTAFCLVFSNVIQYAIFDGSDFKEINGHTVVPQNNTGPLGGWVRMQRVAYKKFQAGEKSTMTSEKALRLMEIGFCFDASANWSGSKQKN